MTAANGDHPDTRTTGAGFGTVRSLPSIGERPPPASASGREYLRSGLPALYRERDGHDFGLRFVGALEELLDPIVALLDTLPAHFSVDLAPADVLELMLAWLGVPLSEEQPTDQRREMLRHAPELGARGGTMRGIELVLKLAHPGLRFRIEEVGGVAWALDPSELPPGPPPSFVVYCEDAIALERQAQVARLIEQVKPAHVAYRLRVKVAEEPEDDPSGGGT
jgi:phage tail-like protein